MNIQIESAKHCVGSGWHKILDRLYAAKPHDVEVHQVKEKFGGLRFYTGSCNNEFDRLIMDAEDESIRTCELCGDPGKPTDKGWIVTRCEGCE